MYISLMNGGLGNQAFQYIFTRYLEEATKTDVFVDDSYFLLRKGEQALNSAGADDSWGHNGYEMEYVFPNSKKLMLLSEFFEEDVWEYMVSNMKDNNVSIAQQLLDNGIDLTMVVEGPDSSTEGFMGTRLLTPGSSFNSSIIRVPENTYFHGYWINPGWLNAYRDIIKKELAFKPIEDLRNRQYEREIRGNFAIGEHIRRGDFVKVGWALPESYYYEANKKLIEVCPDGMFFVFSDDIGWCKENAEPLGLPQNTVFVEGNYDHKNNYIDMQLMAMCNVLVVGSSSFSFLASLLNETPGFLPVQLRNPSLEDIARIPMPFS